MTASISYHVYVYVGSPLDDIKNINAKNNRLHDTPFKKIHALLVPQHLIGRRIYFSRIVFQAFKHTKRLVKCIHLKPSER